MKVFSKTIAFKDESSLLLEIFKKKSHVFFLDSSLSDDPNGRFSFLGFDPFKIVRPKTLAQLRKEIKPYLGIRSSFRFPAGAVGYIGYEGEICFGLYDCIISLDHKKKTLRVSSLGLPSKSLKNRKEVAQKKLEQVLFEVKNYQRTNEAVKKSGQRLEIKSRTTALEYEMIVKKALKHIHDGDIYQINLSHRFDVNFKDHRQHVLASEIYQQLRQLSPSSFSAYMDLGKKAILSSSPERFLQLKGDIVSVRPMKGTRPRSSNKIKDKKNRQELLESPKEKAELLMVTDLERNDLGRVCCYGSVTVKDMRTIEEYRNVFQATSTIEGRLHKDFDQFDLLKSTFPSGSVTGCPKIEAMKLIAKLERSNRGLYTGALGYISFTGDMDFNVLIRTLFLKKDKISFYVGGGIVADSNPRKEYEETILKAKAMMETLKNVF